jgi:excisionase family DNA binding protein
MKRTSNSDLPKFAPVSEVAEALGISKKSVRRLCATEKLAAEKLAGRWCIPVRALEELAEPDNRKKASRRRR